MREATFSDSWPLEQAEVAPSIVEEVVQRTPGYVCWQTEEWLSCCSDACAFHGDAPVEELRALDSVGLVQLAATSHFPVDILPELIAAYSPGGSPSFYKFVCLHCARIHYGGDGDSSSHGWAD